MYKTLTVGLNCSKSDYKYLMSCFRLSAEVWNKCLEEDENYKKETKGKWIGRSELQKRTKGCVVLHAKGIQHVVHKYLYSRDASFKAIKQGRRDEKVTYKKKKYFVTGWDYQSIRSDENNLYLQRPSINNKRQKLIRCKVNNLPDNIKQVELIYKDKPYLAIKHKDTNNYKSIKSDNHASIDLGEIHSITSIDHEGHALIITGRRLREIKHLRNKQQSKIYKRLSRCTKGSKQYYKYRRALRNLKFKTERKINDTIHKMSRLYLNYCLEYRTSVVYYGELDSATRGTKRKRRGSKIIRQKLSQWNYGQIIKQLENKLSRYEIKMIPINEAYTSQTCPNCKNKYHPKGRDYICEKCGYKQHRDIVGAINILNFNDGCEIINYNTKLYLQIA